MFHDELRRWLGIKLDRPACGQDQVELVFSAAEKWREAKALRGCSVTATGILFDSPTRYYSAEMAISDANSKPDASCRQHAVEPDPTAVPISPTVTSYHATIVVDYRGKGHVEVRVWREGDKPTLLTPWQAFVNYTLTGGQDLIWFDCQKGFQIGEITQSPENPKGVLKESDSLTGAGLQDLNGVNKVKFVCQKKSNTSPPHAQSPQLKPS